MIFFYIIVLQIGYRYIFMLYNTRQKSLTVAMNCSIWHPMAPMDSDDHVTRSPASITSITETMHGHGYF